MASIVKGAASHKFHDEEEHAIDFSKIMDPNQSGVIQARHGLSLSFKAFREIEFVFGKWRQQLDGDVTIQSGLTNWSITPV